MKGNVIELDRNALRDSIEERGRTSRKHLVILVTQTHILDVALVLGR